MPVAYKGGELIYTDTNSYRDKELIFKFHFTYVCISGFLMLTAHAAHVPVQVG